jgi:hypothetical protein
MMGTMSEAGWNELRAFLGGRRPRGWYLDEDEMAWCFGLGGACRLAASVRGEQFVVYDADADDETVFDDLAQLAAAIPALERSHRGFSSVYRQILDSSLHLDPAELAEHQRQLAAQDAALDAD